MRLVQGKVFQFRIDEKSLEEAASEAGISVCDGIIDPSDLFNGNATVRLFEGGLFHPDQQDRLISEEWKEEENAIRLAGFELPIAEHLVAVSLPNVLPQGETGTAAIVALGVSVDINGWVSRVCLFSNCNGKRLCPIVRNPSGEQRNLSFLGVRRVFL